MLGSGEFLPLRTGLRCRLGAMRDTSDIRWPVNSTSADAVRATDPIGHRPS